MAKCWVCPDNDPNNHGTHTCCNCDTVLCTKHFAAHALQENQRYCDKLRRLRDFGGKDEPEEKADVVVQQCHECKLYGSIGGMLVHDGLTYCNNCHDTVICISNEKNVSHPRHYNQGQFEVIDVIQDWGLGFSLGNTVKYIARAKFKGRYLEDLEKALFYLQYEIDKTKNRGGTQR